MISTARPRTCAAATSLPEDPDFIDLSSADPDRYGLSRNAGITLKDKDVSRSKGLLKYRWFQKKDWQEEVKRVLSSGLKCELDALANKDVLEPERQRLVSLHVVSGL